MTVFVNRRHERRWAGPRAGERHGSFCEGGILRALAASPARDGQMLSHARGGVDAELPDVGA